MATDEGAFMKVFGVQFVVSSAEDGLWFDSDEHYTDKKSGKGWGIVFKLRGGQVIRPINGKWFGDGQGGGYPTRVLKFNCPIPVLPFFSIAIGRFGFYVGFKDFGVDSVHYKNWLPTDWVKEGNTALCPSFSIRRTRLD